VSAAARLRALAAEARAFATQQRVAHVHALCDRRPLRAALHHVAAACADGAALVADARLAVIDPPPPRAQAVPRPTQMN
jgi:hypothetical protein